MEIELHICSFQNPFSLFFLFLTECLRIPFLFTLTLVLLEKSLQKKQRKAYRRSLCLYSFPNSFHLTLSTPSQEGSGSISKWGNNAKGTKMPGPGLQDFIFQHPLTPEFGLDGDIKNPNIVFSKCYCVCQSTQKFMLKSSHLGCRTPVSSTFLTTKLALKVVTKVRRPGLYFPTPY